MNAGPTSERIYDALKSDVLGRLYRPGDHLEPAAIAERLASSVTPVRDALHLLTGEGLVESRHSEGFRVPPVDEPGLQDLYDWCGALAQLALRQRNAIPAFDRNSTGDDLAARIARLFEAIAMVSSNVEYRRAVRATNDRLYAARTVEPQVLAGCEGELDRFTEAAERADTSTLRKLLRTYIGRRRRAAAALVRALYRRERP